MFDGRHARYLILAGLEARHATHKHRLGAIVVKGSRILGKGASHTWHYRHAELIALGKNWKSEYRDATIYVVRLRPCSVCWQAIKNAGIKTVFYSTSDSLFPFRMESVI